MITGKNVLVAEPLTGSEKSIEYLHKAGCQVLVGPHTSQQDKKMTEEDLIKLGNENDAFIVLSREKLTKKVLENSKRLKIICKSGSGVDNIDIATATKQGILVTNAPMNSSAVAEHTIALILSLYKKIPYNNAYIRAGHWRDDSCSGHDLRDKTLGLLGFGNIARQVVQRLQGWDLNIIAYDPYVSPDKAAALGVKLVSFEEVLKTADIISIHMLLNDQTRGMINEKAFAMMKKTAIIVNTARGGVINNAALINALNNKSIAGAALDNHETEPIKQDNPILKCDNVIITPHVAGFSFEALERIAMQAAINCLNALNGKKPDFIFNPDVYDRWYEENFGEKGTKSK